jgi:hypothetical protein
MKSNFKKGQKATYKHITMVDGKFVKEFFEVTILEIGNAAGVCVLFNGQPKWTEVSNVTI